MWKDLEPEDTSIKNFQVHKKFTFSNNDSASGVYGVDAISGSTYNFTASGAPSLSFGDYNSLSASLEKSAYWATFYKLPLYGTVRQLYYRDLDVHGTVNMEHWSKPSSSFASILTASNVTYLSGYRHTFTSRQLHNTVNVITIPRKFYGEKIRPGSVVLKDDSLASTLELRDDEQGNLYDIAYSQSYSIASESVGSDGQLTGSVVGNVIYEHGIVTITDTGSAYGKVGITSGSDGFQVSFDSTQTIYEREYVCSIGPNELGSTTNRSLTPGYSGSWSMGSGSISGDISASVSIFNSIPIPPGSSSYPDSIQGTGSLLPVVTSSGFGPYITTIGLYNDFDELMVIGKLAHPIKNDPELAMTFVVRFDT